jgi:hypothetical protein
MVKLFEEWVIHKHVDEKLMLKDWSAYRKLVADAYDVAPEFDASVVKHWQALNESNHILFKRLLSKTKIILISADEKNEGETLYLLDEPYIIQKFEGDPYPTQKEMKGDWENTGTIMISIDYSDHPVFSVADNVIFRCVHDFIVHILGDHEFGDKGEIASYNLHAKLVPPLALPALFTEVVGQACYAVEYGGFPTQKIALLDGFDYYKVGQVIGREIVDKMLV